MSLELNRTGIAEHMGVSLPTIDRWVREGCPVKQRGARGVEWVFVLVDVIRWWGDRKAAQAAGAAATDEAEADRRKKVAGAEMVELELAKAKGEVATIADFERAEARKNAAIRQNVLNVPQRVVTQLLGCTDETEFKAKLRAELVLALEAAAEADLALDDEEDSEDSEEA